MHPYIPHLLADIANAHRNEIPYDSSEQSLEEELEAIDINRLTPVEAMMKLNELVNSLKK